MGIVISAFRSWMRARKQTVQQELSDGAITEETVQKAVVCKQCRVLRSANEFIKLSRHLEGFFEDESEFLCYQCIGMTDEQYLELESITENSQRQDLESTQESVLN